MEFDMTEIEDHSLDILIAPGIFNKLSNVLALKSDALMNLENSFKSSTMKIKSMSPIVSNPSDYVFRKIGTNDAELDINNLELKIKGNLLTLGN